MLVVSPDVFIHLRPVVSLLGLVKGTVYIYVSRGRIFMKSFNQGGYLIFLNDLERAVWVGLVFLVKNIFNNLKFSRGALNLSLGFLITGRGVCKGSKI